MDQTQAANVFKRAFDLHKKEHLREAEALYRELLEVPYEAAVVHTNLGLLEFSTGRYADAVTNLERGLGQRPKPDYHNVLGRAYEALGRIEEAMANYARAIELRVGFTEAQDNLTRLQAAHGAREAHNLVSIITPTVGRPELARAIRSVSVQRYRNIKHLIIADGPEFEAAVRKIVEDVAPVVPTQVLTLPWNTGRDNFRGHRAYAAAIHLVNGRFVGFLDDDNWLDEDHISSLVNCAISFNLEWAYSLRKIIGEDGAFVANDDCHSLGAWESIEAASEGRQSHLVDTNCYLLRRDIAVIYSATWHRRAGDAKQSPDAVLCQALLADRKRVRTTGKYSVNYSLGPERTASFFLEGNATMRQRYPSGFPWAV